MDVCPVLCNSDFYPRPPRGGRRVCRAGCLVIDLFLSTPSARRATADFNKYTGIVLISIHALREEGDREAAALGLIINDISIHALREEGDLREIPADDLFKAFLSTPSARRATRSKRLDETEMSISIHALREEGDFRGSTLGIPAQNFYPRPPRGGRPSVRW